jgi:uncharacterized protein YjbI with pentapeptide repeats
MKVEIKSRHTHAVLFAYEADTNTLKASLEAAISTKANLRGANLRGANLSGATLDGANLYGANLSGANLRGADLRGAYLASADLRDADLSGADLDGADLDGAILDGAKLGGATLANVNLDGEILKKPPKFIPNLRWQVLITDRFMRIGCQRHDHKSWGLFTDDEISSMAPGFLDFWNEYRTPLLALCAQHSEEAPE